MKSKGQMEEHSRILEPREFPAFLREHMAGRPVPEAKEFRSVFFSCQALDSSGSLSVRCHKGQTVWRDADARQMHEREGRRREHEQ